MRYKEIITESNSDRYGKEVFRTNFIFEAANWGNQNKNDSTISKFKRFSPKQIISWALAAGLSIGSLSYIVSDAEAEIQVIRTMNRLMMTEPQKAKEYVDWINKRLSKEIEYENSPDHISEMVERVNGIVPLSNVEKQSGDILSIKFTSEPENILEGFFEGKYITDGKYVRLISGILNFGSMKLSHTLETSWNSKGKVNGRFEERIDIYGGDGQSNYITIGNAKNGIIDDDNIVIQVRDTDSTSMAISFHYHGGFRNGKRNGPGRLTLKTSRNTTITIEGNWKNDKVESVTNLVTNDKIFRPDPREQDSNWDFVYRADGKSDSPYNFFPHNNKWNYDTSSFPDGNKTPPIYTKASDDIPPEPEPIENFIQRQNLTNKKIK